MRYQVFDWVIDPELNQIRRDLHITRLEPLPMSVLSHLLEHAGRVVPTDELLDRFWPGRNAEPSMVTRCIKQLRHALGDDARNPTYVETVRKRGYRVIAPVRHLQEGATSSKFPIESDAQLTAIAVMPFDDLSPGGGHVWLGDGMAEELIEALSRISGLRVPTRNSTTFLKAQQADIQTIGHQLNTGSVVTGSVRRLGERLTVVVEWLRISDETHLWSARYDRLLDDVFAIQRELAVGIAEAIRAVLGIHDTTASMLRERYQTTDVRAWELFREGFELINSFDPENLATGRRLLQHSLELDPDYVEALATLAWSDFDHPQQRIEGAKRVLKLDPTNPTAHHLLIDDSITCWDFATAERLWDVASAANPHSNLLTIMGFHVYRCTGQLHKALDAARRGVHLEPLWNVHQDFLGFAHMCLGDFDKAIAPLERGISFARDTEGTDVRRSSLPAPVGWLRLALDALATAHWHAEHPADALDAMLLAYPDQQQVIRAGWADGGWQSMNRALADALTTVPSLGGSSSPRPESPIASVQAQLLARAGETERMYAYFEQLMEVTRETNLRDRKAYRNVCFLASALNSHFDFSCYRQEPRFQEIKGRLDERISGAAGTYAHAPAVSFTAVAD